MEEIIYIPNFVENSLEYMNELIMLPWQYSSYFKRSYINITIKKAIMYQID